MYIITYLFKLDLNSDDFYDGGCYINNKENLKDNLEYFLKCQNVGIVKDVRVWNSEEISYKDNIEVNLDIDLD